MKRFSLLRMGALTAAVVCLLPPATVADDYDKKTIVTFDQPTEVPGIVLQPGKYVIKLLNSSSDRHIAEIMNERMDHLYALTFTASAERPERTGKAILTFYEGTNGQPQALRQWFWPGELTGQEFLYPKEQAARIASNTNQKVAEGGLPTVAESGQSLKPDNAKAVTLQSSDQNKPAARPFTARAAEPPAAPVVVAQNNPPPSQSTQSTRSTDTSQSNSTASSNAASNAQPSDADSSDKALPQTASYLPVLGALGIFSLALAILVGSVRRYRSL